MRWRDPLILVALLLVVWQLLYLAVGDVALRSPWTTAGNLGAMLEDVRFIPHVRETLVAFAQGFLIAVVVGLAIIMSIFRTRRSASVDDANLLKY